MTGQPRSSPPTLIDSGERMIPTEAGEISFTYERHAFAYRYARQFVEGKTVLDVGCGTGYGAHILAQRARAVTAVDKSEEAIAYCRAHSAGPCIEFCVQRTEELSFSAPFDVGVSFQMIEHLQDPLGFLRSLRQAVTPRGVILISTPNLRAGHSAGEENPFHLSEMTFGEFSALLDASFQSYRLLGIAPSTAPVWRRALRRLPFYRWGRGIRRTNPLKRIANRAMDLTNFRVIDHAVAAEAIDLLAICDNE